MGQTAVRMKNNSTAESRRKDLDLEYKAKQEARARSKQTMENKWTTGGSVAASSIKIEEEKGSGSGGIFFSMFGGKGKYEKEVKEKPSTLMGKSKDEISAQQQEVKTRTMIPKSVLQKNLSKIDKQRQKKKDAMPKVVEVKKEKGFVDKFRG